LTRRARLDNRSYTTPWDTTDATLADRSSTIFANKR
jgi:hypothetical protein